MVCLLLMMPLSALAKADYLIKFATLAPPGTAWMNLLEEWGETVKNRSNGRLAFKFYPGGVQGDEPEVLKKMRFCHLAMCTRNIITRKSKIPTGKILISKRF